MWHWEEMGGVDIEPGTHGPGVVLHQVRAGLFVMEAELLKVEVAA